MKSKLSIVILGFFGLFVIIQSLTLDPDNLKKYYKCWTFAQCYSDGPAADKFEKCITDSMTQDDVDDAYQFIKDNYSHYKSDNFDDAVKEYCNEDDDTRHEMYNKQIDGFVDYEKKTCEDPSTSGRCARVAETLQCVFSLLDQLKQKGKCKLRGKVKNVVQV
ncbi:uncharacterized protein LOC129971114 [Argiope bruennichi]|uniref:uncharacterized protein LOC129971114 n=1 Tax=Argiope bruennichi TaxID=94029 RepID=UPI002495964A|nr:uncharacterized protein LOC129971114 [Argiope bruennichi]